MGWFLIFIIAVWFICYSCDSDTERAKRKRFEEEKQKKIQKAEEEQTKKIKDEKIINKVQQNKQEEKILRNIDTKLKELEDKLKGEDYMLNPDIYELIKIETISKEELVFKDHEANFILFEGEVNRAINKYKKEGYTIEVGNMTSTLLKKTDYSIHILLSINLILYKTKEQIKLEKERIEYLETIYEYNLIKEILNDIFHITLPSKETRGKEVYKDLEDKILKELKEVEKKYNYKSKEYENSLKEIYDYAEKEFDRLNKKYK